MSICHLSLYQMRPLLFKQISLAANSALDPAGPTVAAEIERYLDAVMTDLLSEIPAGGKLPLVRLSVDVTGFPSIPIQLFGAKFVGKIANPSSLLNLRRKRLTGVSRGGEAKEETSEGGGAAQFETMVRFIERSVADGGGLKFLNVRHMREACEEKWGFRWVVSQFVNKGCSGSWKMMLEHVDRLSEETMKRLDLREANVDQIVRVMKEVREECMSDVGI